MEKYRLSGEGFIMVFLKSKFFTTALVFNMICASFIGCSSVEDMQGENLNSNSKTPEITEIKNVILLIGDGMGTTYTTAYRYYKDNLNTSIMEKTSFDSYLVGLQTTYSFDENHNITDSAAAATSLSSGVKTYNGAIAVDMHEDDVKTVLEFAKELGKSTGLIATSTINHATPAAFGAHNKSRKNYQEIANAYYDDLVDGKHKVDILLGGGRNEFIREDRNLVDEFKKDGYAFVTTRKELLENQNEQVIGLFAEGALPKMIDRSNETPSLEDMTLAAIEQLSKNENGFFLMVEGSQIDWGGHDNDIVSVMSEMEDFEKAFQAAIDFAKKDKNTLVIATADHETGGLSVGSGSNYNWNFDVIRQVTRTPSFIANKIIAEADVEKALKKYIKFSLTREEVNKIIDKINSNPAETSRTIVSIINKRSNTGWTTKGHTGQDVPVYAFGPGSALFAGLTDNTETAKNIIKMLNLSH